MRDQLNSILQSISPNSSFGEGDAARSNVRLFWWVNGLFVFVNALFLLNELYFFVALPFIALILFLAVRRMDFLLFGITFIIPFSIQMDDIGMGFGLSLPAEPLLFLLFLLFLAKLLLIGGFDRKIIQHPISLLITAMLLWMGITNITSSMPFVSFKFFLSHVWFIAVFYFLALSFFKEIKNIRRFIWVYSISLSCVIVYTIYQHYLNGFGDKAAHWVMTPFYNDHTQYAAVIAMFIPAIACLIFTKNQPGISRWILAILLFIAIAGIILSYTRAAWVSLAASFAVLILMLLKIKFRTLLFFLSGILILFFSFQTEILLKLERNRQDSSKNLSNHLESISNISTDASNLERINRWNSAWRMFLDRPMVGFGPGTYQFQYAPFQHSSQKTIISTNFGSNGTAHSEYLLPLSEQGFLGFLLFTAIVIAVAYKALRLYSDLKEKELKLLILGTFLGLSTYFTHAFLNNFLDTDKASAPFWGFIAIIVSIDLYHKNRETSESELPQ